MDALRYIADPKDVGPATAVSPTDKPAPSEDRDAASRVALPLQAAEAVIRALADELTAELRAKGEPEAVVCIWVGWKSSLALTPGIVVNVDFAKASAPHIYVASIAKGAAKLREWIATLPDPAAADAWFDERHPLNQPACAWCEERPATVDAYDPPAFIPASFENERVCEPCLERAAERQAERAMEEG